MKKISVVLTLFLLLSSGFTKADDFARRFPTDTPLAVVTPAVAHATYSVKGHTHPIATTLADGFLPTLSGNPNTFLDGTGNYVVPVVSSVVAHTHPIYDPLATNGYTPMSVYGIHSHPIYDSSDKVTWNEYSNGYGTHAHPNYSTGGYGINTAHPEYTPYSVYGIHTHSNYVPYTGATSTVNLGSQHLVAAAATSGTEFNTVQANTHIQTKTLTATGTGSSSFSSDVSVTGNLTATTSPWTLMSVYGIHTHPQYASVSQPKIANAHAVATTTATGFMPILSSVATQYLDGTGNWSVPAGTATGGSGVSYQSAAYPQALQGIEQLRHAVQAYQQYGNIIVDGLQDQTGITQATNLTYSGSSNYYYGLSAGGDPLGDLTIHFNGTDGQTTYTAETGQTVSFISTAQLDTAQKEFGLSSLLVNGSSDYVSVPDDAAWNLGTGNFGISFWVRFNSVSQPCGFFNQDNGNNNEFASYWYNYGAPNNKIFLIDYTSAWALLAQWTWNPSINVWYHVEFDRIGTGDQCVRCYINGNSLGDATLGQGAWNWSVSDRSSALYVGTDRPSTYFMNGWIDEFHWVKGSSLHSSNFTVPSMEFGASGGSTGYVHTISYPMPATPTHLGVSVKLDSALTNGQHYYLNAAVSRDGGTTFTDCHPIIKAGNQGYYYANMSSVAGQPSGSNVVAKIGLANNTTAKLKGYGVYGE